MCHASLVGKRGGGFWEGGKGTRDKKLMSRKGEKYHSNPLFLQCDSSYMFGASSVADVGVFFVKKTDPRKYKRRGANRPSSSSRK